MLLVCTAALGSRAHISPASLTNPLIVVLKAPADAGVLPCVTGDACLSAPMCLIKFIWRCLADWFSRWRGGGPSELGYCAGPLDPPQNTATPVSKTAFEVTTSEHNCLPFTLQSQRICSINIMVSNSSVLCKIV